MTLVDQIKAAVREALSGDQSSKVKEFETQIAELIAQVADLTAKLAKAEADLATSQATVAEQTATITARDKELTGLKAELDEEKKKSDDVAKQVDEAAGKKAAQIMSATGAKPLAVKPGGNPAGGDELEAVRQQMKAEKDPAKRYALALKARELRGHKELFAGK